MTKRTKSTKLCTQFLWDMNIKSGMGAQEINFPLPYTTEDIFQYLPGELCNQAFS